MWVFGGVPRVLVDSINSYIELDTHIHPKSYLNLQARNICDPRTLFVEHPHDLYFAPGR